MFCITRYVLQIKTYHTINGENTFHVSLLRMFELVTFEDYVRIEPFLFNKDLADACRTEINRKLANKVYQRAGLCICMHDILKIGDSAILPGEGLW